MHTHIKWRRNPNDGLRRIKLLYKIRRHRAILRKA